MSSGIYLSLLGWSIPVCHGIELKVDIPNDALLYPLDILEYTRALTNLLLNACVHNAKGCSVLVSVEKVHGKSEDKCVVAVADRGEQISETMKHRMFEAFSSGDESRNSKGGSGLGLAIAKRIVEKHHGTLVLKEHYGNYSKAFVMEYVIPIKQR